MKKIEQETNGVDARVEIRTNPIVFVSYSWDSQGHKTWVRDLAAKLIENGVQTYLDQWGNEWGLPPGSDRVVFMNKILESDYVLMICTPKYVQKANKMKAGVGEEQGIIIGESAYIENQTKCIPILREDKRVPAYFGTKIFIDFRDDDLFESKFEELIRVIFDLPAYKPPQLGKPPAHLFHPDPYRDTYQINTPTNISRLFSEISPNQCIPDSIIFKILIEKPSSQSNLFPTNNKDIIALFKFAPFLDNRQKVSPYPKFLQYSDTLENINVDMIYSIVREIRLYPEGKLLTYGEIRAIDDEIFNLLFFSRILTNFLLYFYRILQYTSNVGDIRIHFELLNLNGKNLELLTHDPLIKLWQRYTLPNNEENILMSYKGTLVENSDFILDDNDVLQLIKEMLKGIMQSFGFLPESATLDQFLFGSLAIASRVINSYTTTNKYKGHKDVTLPGFKFSPPLSKVPLWSR